MAPLPSISIASVVIGFISFAFTLAIWLHNFWDAFLTVGSASSQIRDELSTLRQALYEEREYLKRKRRQAGGDDYKSTTLYNEGGPTKIINEAVKDLIQRFKIMEAPFLETDHHGREKELEWSFECSQHYYRVDLSRRLLWLRYKGGVQGVARKLDSLQTRRIAVEVTELHFELKDMHRLVRDAEDRLGAIESRL